MDDMMQDRLVCGIKDDTVQRRLLAEPDLKYKRAVELALAVSVQKHARLEYPSEGRRGAGTPREQPSGCVEMLSLRS